VINERDLSPGFLIAGPARSGRSGALTTLAAQLPLASLGGLVIASSRSPLRDWAFRCGLAVTWSDDDKAVVMAGRFDSGVLLVDDVDKLAGSLLEDAVLELLVNSRAVVVAAGRTEDLLTSYRGVGVELRRNRTGLLLNPGMADGDLLGVRTAAGAVSRTAGRGVLVIDRLRADHPNGMTVQLMAPDHEPPALDQPNSKLDHSSSNSRSDPIS
jgi:S-DNA-T family DNA segregation ATPase FtsK/SpoIIIE